MVPAPGFCTLPARSSRKYKSLTMFQWFQHLAFVLWQSCQLESTNDLRSFNGSSTWLLYFGNPASSRVQMIYEASRGQALAVCTLAFSALLHGANTRQMPVHAPRQIQFVNSFIPHIPDHCPELTLRHDGSIVLNADGAAPVESKRYESKTISGMIFSGQPNRIALTTYGTCSRPPGILLYRL